MGGRGSGRKGGGSGIKLSSGRANLSPSLPSAKTSWNSYLKKARKIAKGEYEKPYGSGAK